MRILFLSSNEYAPWGGSEELWAGAALRMARSFEVAVSVKRWPVEPPAVGRLRASGVEVRPRSPDPLVVRALRKVAGLRPDFLADRLREARADFAVVSQGGNYDGVGWMNAAAALDIPYAAIVQANAETWWPSDAERESWRKAYLGAAHVFFVADRNAQLLEDQLASRLPRKSTVWNPWNLSVQSALPWPDERDGLRLACVARLDVAAKGQDVLLRAIAASDWANRNARIDFFGGGQHEQGMRALAAHLGLRNVRFEGHVDDVGDIWRRSHVLLLPSRFEGTSLALLEAMWAGRPAIATDVGGTAHVCVDDVTGFVAPAATAPMIHHALERAWTQRDRWREMGMAARERIERMAPRDPIAYFCDQLAAVARATARDASTP